MMHLTSYSRSARVILVIDLRLSILMISRIITSSKRLKRLKIKSEKHTDSDLLMPLHCIINYNIIKLMNKSKS